MRMSQIIWKSSETDALRQFVSCKSKGKERKQGKIGLGYDTHGAQTAMSCHRAETSPVLQYTYGMMRCSHDVWCVLVTHC